jgi:Na+/melibiose symporter-like transporter
LSIVGLVALVYAIIQAPEKGWTSSATIGVGLFGIVVLVAFALWERYTPSPMLDTSFWKNPRFSAASAGIMLLFFAMFGSIFLLTQYLQFVMGYDALAAGIGLLPMALTMLVVAPNSPRLVERIGTKKTVGAGLAIAGLGLALMAMLPATDISYWGDVAWRLIIMATGMGLTMAPATESIMGSLPRAKAGVGSAVNDTTRQVGGALGVAIIGSVMASAFGSRVDTLFSSHGVPPQGVDVAKEGLGQAIEVASNPQVPGSVSAQLIEGAKEAFVTGAHHGLWVAAVVAFLGAAIVFKWLPARELPAVDDPGALPAAAVADTAGADTAGEAAEVPVVLDTADWT